MMHFKRRPIPFQYGNSRRKTLLQESNTGFTIVELLIVIVVIAILAALTIVGYNGITKRATESTMKSDLQGAATLLGIDYQDNSIYPSTSVAANGGKGLKSSGDNQLSYTTTGTSFCISISNSRTSAVFKFNSSDGTVTDGDCPINNIVSTFAGSGTSGYVDGAGTVAQFAVPNYLAFDTSGNLYVTDSFLIRKVSPSGIVSTFAGSGISGYAEGTGTAAQFGGLGGLAFDASGNLYVVDNGNFRIRKISPAGVVSTFAGSGASGYVDGAGTVARFSSGFGLASDTSGNLYFADNGNYRIRKISPAGVVSTFAGSGVSGYADGTGTAAQFKIIHHLAFDASGNLFVADMGNHRIRKISPAGVVSTFAGSGVSGYADGTGTAAQFASPTGLAFDTSSNLYVSENGNYRIRKISPAGVVSTFAGSGVFGYADGAGTVARFGALNGLAFDASGNLYVGDPVNYRVRKINW